MQKLQAANPCPGYSHFAKQHTKRKKTVLEDNAASNGAAFKGQTFYKVNIPATLPFIISNKRI